MNALLGPKVGVEVALAESVEIGNGRLCWRCSGENQRRCRHVKEAVTKAEYRACRTPCRSGDEGLSWVCMMTVAAGTCESDLGQIGRPEAVAVVDEGEDDQRDDVISVMMSSA